MLQTNPRRGADPQTRELLKTIIPEGHKIIGSIQRRALKIGQGLEGKVCEEQLKSPGWFSAEQRS